MRKSRFTEQQIAFALRQAETGMKISLMNYFLDGVPKSRGFHRTGRMKCSGNGLM